MYQAFVIRNTFSALEKSSGLELQGDNIHSKIASERRMTGYQMLNGAVDSDFRTVTLKEISIEEHVFG